MTLIAHAAAGIGNNTIMNKVAAKPASDRLDGLKMSLGDM
jgi:hypothetical protein